MRLAENMQILRKREGLSQEELAEKCQVSRQAVTKWEMGESTPSLDKLVCLADLYNVSLDEIVGRTKKNLYVNPLGIENSLYEQKRRELLINSTAFKNIIIEEAIKNIDEGKICTEVADSYGITKEDIIGKDKGPLLRDARWVSMYLMSQLLKISNIRIGEYMNRDAQLFCLLCIR